MQEISTRVIGGSGAEREDLMIKGAPVSLSKSPMRNKSFCGDLFPDAPRDLVKRKKEIVEPHGNHDTKGKVRVNTIRKVPRRIRGGVVPNELSVPLGVGWNLGLEGSGCKTLNNAMSVGDISLQTTTERQGDKGESQGDKGESQIQTRWRTRPGDIEPEGLEVL